MSDIKDICEIRDYAPEDKSFICATFLRGLYYGNEFYNMMPKDVFMNNYKQVIEALLLRNQVKVACLKEDPDVILGYSMLSKDYNTLHWVFVKSAWRKQGIMKLILPDSLSTYTHFTTLGLKLLNKYNNPVFNPFQL